MDLSSGFIRILERCPNLFRFEVGNLDRGIYSEIEVSIYTIKTIGVGLATKV